MKVAKETSDTNTNDGRDQSIQDFKNTIADKSCVRRRMDLRQSYLRRLESFTPLNYFAKPEALSPIVCARFGWKLIQKDTLCCEYCRAVWVILLPDEWWSGRDALIRSYCLKMAEAHKEACCYRSPAKQYVQREYSGDSIPTVLASVFPEESFELYEVPDPIHLFREKCKKLKALLQAERALAKHIEIPTEMQREEPSTMQQLRQLLFLDLSNEEEVIVDDAAILLTLFGWQKPDASLSSSCPFCLASWTLPQKMASEEAPANQEEKEDMEEQRPWKRLRNEVTVSPLLAHRHYCPIVCGFPTMKQLQAKPLYKSLFDRLLNPPDSTIDDETINEIHKMLLSGIAAKKLPLSPKELSAHAPTNL